MGNTTRRQSVSFNIPASPNYKYQNIVDFKGISITSNPFNAEYNTASDLLNVYVDEEHALTTRPRLEPVEEIIDTSSITEYLPHTLIKLPEKISPNTYLQTRNNGMLFLIPGNIRLAIYSNVTAFYDCFVQDNVAIILTNDGLYEYHNENNVFKKIEPRIPHRFVAAKTEIDRSKRIEELNALTDKYYVDYTWDGTWDISQFENEFDVSTIKDSYIKEVELANTPRVTAYKYIPNFLNGSSLKTTPSILVQTMTKEGIQYTCKYYTVSFDVNSPTEPLVWTPIGQEMNVSKEVSDFDVNATGEAYIQYGMLGSQMIQDSVIVFIKSRYKSSPTYLELGDKALRQTKRLRGWSLAKMNHAGTIIAYVTDAGLEIKKYMSITDYSSPVMSYSIPGTHFTNVRMSDNGDIITVYELDDSEAYVKNIKVYNSNGTLLNTIALDLADNRLYDFAISPDGQKMAVKTYKGLMYFSDLINNPTLFSIILPETNHDLFKISFTTTSDRLMLYGSQTQGWLVLSTMTFIQSPVLAQEFSPQANVTGWTDYFTNDTFLIFSQNELLDDRDNSTTYTTTLQLTKYKFGAADCTFSVEHQLTEDDPSYERWALANSDVNNIKHYARFGNKLMLASNNALFSTNDPKATYLSIADYVEIGNRDEDHITALNLIADGILGVFKNNAIWYYTEDTSTGIAVPFVKEAKLNMGNNTFNGAITTQYSNMPLVINYNGVYNTRQMENVNIMDTLALCMSDDISAKWIKETHEAIDNASVINIKYWTIITLKGNITKMYVLDNRDNSWYYWELPIETHLIWVNNDTVYILSTGQFRYHVVDGVVTKLYEAFTLYKLTTEDIVNENGTEYYDYVIYHHQELAPPEPITSIAIDNKKEIIPWYWESQILPLGTINYSKKLVNTTFILTDTDENDEYGLNYQFTAYRKTANATSEKTLTNKLNFVQSTTKKTLLQRFNFLKFKLSNIVADDTNIVDESRNHNKFRLVGIGLKYLLLEGL